MIPKIIHYCWFGTKQIPEDYQGYIDGWKKLMPDYEIKLWNEENSPMHLPYLQAALKYKKWANLSNFVRIYALYHEGGIYMDTDMEVLKSLEEFRQYGSFLGLEMGDRAGENLIINNAIFGSEKGHPFIVKCMDFCLKNFDGRDTALDSSPYLVTRLLKEEGLYKYGRQNIGGVELFEREYFYPYHITEKFTPECVKENTYTIHHWGYSWGTKPFSYRLEHYKKVTKDKVLKALPIHYEGRFQHGKIIGDLLKNGNVKAGPFADVKLAITRDFDKEKLPLKLAGLYKEELQSILYQLTNKAYETIYYNGKSSHFFGKGLAKLFPKSNIKTFSPGEGKELPLNNLGERTLLITNSALAKEIVDNLVQLPEKTDIVLEFNHHLPTARKETIKREIGNRFDIEFVPSTLNYQYEQNAFLQNYSLKEIEQHLKKEVTDVQEWLILKNK